MTKIMDRMKRYEKSWRTVITPRMPVIIRLDGHSFHNYTKKCDRPFDQKLIRAMWEVAKVLCNEIQGAQLAYIQSDEISILIHNYKTLNSESWFGNQIQKMVSISAAIASVKMSFESNSIFGEYKPAEFDSRAFSVPEADVCNMFIARQQDWTRNSVQMLARSLYSHKQLHGKRNHELQELIFQKNHNWDGLPTYLKRGACVIKQSYVLTNHPDRPTRSRWATDENIPIFTQDRDYIDRHLKVEES